MGIMGKRNRKKKHSVFTAGSMGIIGLVVTIFIMLMTYWSLDSRCSTISRDILAAEKRYAALEAECVQEMAHWDSMKTPERLSEKLLRFGLEMKYPHPDQVIRMSADGQPVPRQRSVVRARQRARTETMVMQAGDISAKERIRPALGETSRKGAAVRR